MPGSAGPTGPGSATTASPWIPAIRPATSSSPSCHAIGAVSKWSSTPRISRSSRRAFARLRAEDGGLLAPRVAGGRPGSEFQRYIGVFGRRRAGELVQRERPGDRRRYCEDDAAEVASGCPVKESGQRRAILRPAKGQRTGDGFARVGAQGKHEGVEVDRVVALELCNVVVRVDLRDRASSELGARRSNQLGQREAAHLTNPERFRHSQGSIR